jgi:hypothetical protein
MKYLFICSVLLVFYFHTTAQNVMYPNIDSIQLVKIKKFESIGIPIFFLTAEVGYDAIGTPEIKLIPKNISKKDIDAYTVQIYCYNNYNEPVNDQLKNTNIFTGTSQDILKAGKTVSFNDSWTLYGYDNTTKVKVYLKKVHFTDGTLWVPKDKKITLVEGKANR